MPVLWAAEPWTDAEETFTAVDAAAASACDTGSDVAGGSCHMAMLQQQVSPARQKVRELSKTREGSKTETLVSPARQEVRELSKTRKGSKTETLVMSQHAKKVRE